MTCLKGQGNSCSAQLREFGMTDPAKQSKDSRMTDMAVFCADLQQAFQKAMSRIGMEAEAPAIDAEILAQTDREQELLDRIAELEAKLQMQAARH